MSEAKELIRQDGEEQIDVFLVDFWAFSEFWTILLNLLWNRRKTKVDQICEKGLEIAF